ncbi:MAG: hypothetical protein J1D87_02680 [Lachnospiraceae bacterium]|nr:hypothetical protein [Lachnospiraceae bacterium]
MSLKKCSKKLAKLYDVRKKINKKYEAHVEKAKCEECSYYNSETVKKLVDRFENCNQCKKRTAIIEVSNELDAILAEIDVFIEEEYAVEVYSHYAKKEPDLIRIRTGETETWKQAFGDNFDKISKGMRHSLVGLVEENLRYKFK